ncbi:MAG TPA: N(4)-(beta-N-acetylglucosaminyl)-L-asparaginase [Tepidisphaeraceae bacterium]|jgi:isoaspartyl peptidase/L-asparaginase-like protein (Ntn-hydrolase superfamily)|nr:N(4)-(beta-N-acetylglucosaminyl)-L-asparaginase [Tepidisphaeraceae bacterium]
MNYPIVISTWPFGMAANDAAWQVLASGGIAMDAVIAGATQCENDPAEHSVGLGGWPDASGEVTLDASVMDHAGRCGAVACMKRVKNAAQVARMVMQRTPHVMLAGEGATQFALANGMREENLLTSEAAARFEQWKRETAAAGKPAGHDTLGILAIDGGGHLAGACTTSGLAFKLPGRVGDSPIIGAGLYVDGKVGAATATGQGEEMIKACGSFAIVENLRRGMEPEAAIADVLQRLAERRNGNVETDVSFLALRADGAFAGMSLRAATNFKFAVTSAAMRQLLDARTL